jgi:hypothetical protein
MAEMSALYSHLFGNGPEHSLVLDGGGIRGVPSISIIDSVGRMLCDRPALKALRA